MKSPAKNMSRSLRGQRPSQGRPLDERGSVKQGMSAGVITGERGVERPPGRVKESSAAHAAEPLDRLAR